MRPMWRRLLGSVAVAVLLGACGSDVSCAPESSSAACSDLDFRGVFYDEWREYDAPPVTRLQELGNATYPDCNVPDGCPGSELDGFGATDVYLLDDVDFADALLGRRQNSDAIVIFVRVGVDPDELGLPR
jgi:hypothetical protein